MVQVAKRGSHRSNSDDAALALARVLQILDRRP